MYLKILQAHLEEQGTKRAKKILKKNNVGLEDGCL